VSKSIAVSLYNSLLCISLPAYPAPNFPPLSTSSFASVSFSLQFPILFLSVAPSRRLGKALLQSRPPSPAISGSAGPNHVPADDRHHGFPSFLICAGPLAYIFFAKQPRREQTALELVRPVLQGMMRLVESPCSEREALSR